MSLNEEMSGSHAESLARVAIGGSGVDPVSHGIAIDPDGNLRSARGYSHREPFEIGRDDSARGDAAVDSSSSKIDGFVSIVAFPLIADLDFVAISGSLFGSL